MDHSSQKQAKRSAPKKNPEKHLKATTESSSAFLPYLSNLSNEAIFDTGPLSQLNLNYEALPLLGYISNYALSQQLEHAFHTQKILEDACNSSITCPLVFDSTSKLEPNIIDYLPPNSIMTTSQEALSTSLGEALSSSTSTANLFSPDHFI